MNRRLYTCVAIGAFFLSLTSPSWSQDATDSRAKFEEVFGQWKTLLEELRLTRLKAQTAEDAELPALKEEYKALLARGEALIPQLRDAAIAVYREEPNADRQITRWLFTISQDYVEADRYEDAEPAVQALIDGPTDEVEIYDLAGRVAFVLNKFEAAKGYFQKAAAAGVMSPQGQAMMSEVDNYIGYWAEEKALREQEENAPEDQQLPRVSIETNKGTLVAELFENEAPETVGNFVSLVEKGFYDGLSFHRVISNFVAQAGCPVGDGTGGPGYEIYCECHQPNYRKHFRGSLSMAHTGLRDTGGSQFFITLVPTAHLNGKHTVFGRIVEGMDVLARLQRRDPSKPTELALAPDKIIRATVIRKRDHKYVPNKVN